MHQFGAVYLLLLFWLGPAPEPRQQITKIDGVVSIDVDDITIGRLLDLWDQATGLRSTIPAALANRTVSIHSTGLRESDAIRKILQSLNLDYVFVEGQGITVTGVSQTAEGESPDFGLEEPTTIIPISLEFDLTEPAIEPPQPPPLIHTPFGPIQHPDPDQVIQLPPVAGETVLRFFKPEPPPAPPMMMTPIGPNQDLLFRPISIYPSDVRR